MALSPDNAYRVRMNVELVVRMVFGVFFVATLGGGYFLFRNFEKLFGRDPAVAGDNEGACVLNKVQAVVIWLHFLAITGGFALFLR